MVIFKIFDCMVNNIFDITIIAVGSVRENFYLEACNEYLKRLSPYAKIKIEELSPESFRQTSEINKVRERESLKLLKRLETNYAEADVYILDESAQQLASIKWPDLLKSSRKKVFVIGGTTGLIKELFVKNNFNFLSLSAMTLPHELVRVVLLEQLYRASCLSRGKQYHY